MRRGLFQPPINVGIFAKYFGLLIPGTHVQSIEDIKEISIPVIIELFFDISVIF